MKAFLVAILLVAVSVAQCSLLGSTAIVGPSAASHGMIAKGGSIVTSGVVGGHYGVVSPGYVATSVVAPGWVGGHSGLVGLGGVGLGGVGLGGVGLGGVGLGGWGLGVGRLGLGYGHGYYH